MHDGSIDVEVELSEEADEMEEIKLFEAYPEVRFATLEVVDDLVFGDGSDKLVAGSLDSPKRDLINANDWELRDPESEESQRWIGIDDGTVAFLQEWKRIQSRAMLSPVSRQLAIPNRFTVEGAAE